MILTSLARAINAYLALDPESKNRLHKLQNTNITIELLPFHFIFQCEFNTTGVIIHDHEKCTAEAKLCGTPLQMLGMLLAKESRQHFFADDLRIEGNAEIGQQVVELFDELHIDWEEYLSHFTGDTPAYHLSRFVRNVKNWLQETDQNLSENIDEYIHEEAAWLPSNEALKDFYDDIDTLRMDLDRIEVKIKKLATQIDEGFQE